MAKSLFAQKFPSLKQFVIDYDAMMTNENFEKLLKIRKSHFNNAEITIFFHSNQFPQLKRLASELPKVIDAINFKTRNDES